LTVFRKAAILKKVKATINTVPPSINIPIEFKSLELWSYYPYLILKDSIEAARLKLIIFEAIRGYELINIP
jgi:hypothetical protein